jgi:hypothetical protein
MGKSKAKPNYRRTVLGLPDLDHSKLAVLNSLTSPGSRRVYQYAIEQFIARKDLSCRHEAGKSVGQRYLSERGVVRGQGLL